MDPLYRPIHKIYFSFVAGCLRMSPTFFLSIFTLQYCPIYPETSCDKKLYNLVDWPVERVHALSQDSFFFSDPGGIRLLPFSCSRWLLDNQKKVKSVASQKKVRKTKKKEAKRTPSESGAIMGMESWDSQRVSTNDQESINKVSYRCQWSIRRV
jgi:hypothetical protein